VMNEGAFVGQFTAAEATQEKIMRAIMRNEDMRNKSVGGKELPEGPQP